MARSSNGGTAQHSSPGGFSLQEPGSSQTACVAGVFWLLSASGDEAEGFLPTKPSCICFLSFSAPPSPSEVVNLPPLNNFSSLDWASFIYFTELFVASV